MLSLFGLEPALFASATFSVLQTVIETECHLFGQHRIERLQHLHAQGRAPAGDGVEAWAGAVAADGGGIVVADNVEAVGLVETEFDVGGEADTDIDVAVEREQAVAEIEGVADVGQRVVEFQDVVELGVGDVVVQFRGGTA